MKIRIGFGYDVHKLVEGELLVIGGLQIEHQKGTLGHSDGDVLIHAIIDALLGAANLRDIGYNFPDNDAKYKNIDSKILLKTTLDLLRKHKYQISNIDSTICMQRPKLKDFIPDMKRILATTLEIEENDISIKATTTEKLGFVGTEQGVSAYAVALIQKN